MDWYTLSDTELLREFGNRIRLARIERKMTQQMLADRAGLNRSTIRDLENGRSINMLSLMQLLRSLEVLDRLDLLLPGSSQSPILAKMHQEKKRVRLPKK